MVVVGARRGGTCQGRVPVLSYARATAHAAKHTLLSTHNYTHTTNYTQPTRAHPQSYRREKRLFNDPERAFGRESRSLKAAYEMLEAGWSAGNIRHVDGGYQQWRFQGFPIESDE